LGHSGNAFDDPALSEEVIRNENAIGLEHAPYVHKGLFSEKKTLETDVGIAAVQDHGIDAGVYDEVVFAVGGAEGMSAVVEVTNSLFVLLRAIGVVTNADILYHWIDLDRIEAAHAEVQCMGDVVARASADDQHILKRRAATVPLQQMN